MATALMAWFSAPAPTTWTSTAPACRTTPAIAPATELGFDLLDTLRISTAGPPAPWPRAPHGVVSPAQGFDTGDPDPLRRSRSSKVPRPQPARPPRREAGRVSWVIGGDGPCPRSSPLAQSAREM